MPPVSFIGGPAGAGKSSICAKITTSDREIKVQNLFRCLNDIGKSEGMSKEEMLSQWESLENKLLERAIQPSMDSKENLVFDTHFSFQPSAGAERAFSKRSVLAEEPFSPVLCHNFLRKLAKLHMRINVFCILSPAEQILSRRIKDGKGNLEGFSEKALDAEVQAELIYWSKAIATLQKFRCPPVFGIFENKEGRIALPTRKVLKAINDRARS